MTDSARSEIRILMLEDDPADARLVERALHKSGVAFSLSRVAAPEEFRQALVAMSPDLVLADHRLPGFGGAEALAVVCQLAPHTPFILVTGSIGEETAVEYMKAGAADYILKDRLARIGPAALGALARKRMELQLWQREQYFRSLIEQAQDVIAVLDASGAIRYASPSIHRILGYTPEELVGLPMHQLVHPEDADGTLRVFTEGMEIGDAGHLLEVRFRHRDGSYRLLEALGRYLLDEPVVRGVVINARDVTERRSLERQLLQAQKMEAVGRLAGGVAHDFNNVLTAILGYAALLLDGLPKLSPLRPDLEEIRKAADHASGLTRQLLAFSRKQVLEMRVLDVNALVTSAHKLLRRLLGEDIDVVATLDTGVGSVRADAAQLEQVIVNLAVNARDAMPDGGRLAIATRNVELDDGGARECPPVQPGRYVLLSFTDAGTGMSAETMSRMFEPFFTTKDVGKGTGLGLSTVYGIVQQSGGYLRCSSSLGHGTTFDVYLPRVDEPAEQIPVRTAVRAPHGLETILLVEDDAPLRGLMRRVLERYDYAVLAAATAEEASALARDHAGPIHLLLTDVVLPGVSGRVLADELRARHESAKVLFMSGYIDDTIAHRGVLSPDTAFIQKPFTSEGLATKVREVLQAGAIC